MTNQLPTDVEFDSIIPQIRKLQKIMKQTNF